jgi:DNA-binding transcriptional MerR regulator
MYFSIGEVSKLCFLEPHVLRYWEQEFSQLAPVKRSGNRRYYQVADILFIRRLKNLLYDDGYTIEGVRTLLSKEANSKQAVSNPGAMHETFNHLLAKLEDLLLEFNTTEESLN